MFERYSDRARQSIFMALWSARNRGGSHIETEDLLHALIREDRGEFGVLIPGAEAVIGNAAAGRRRFFADDVAGNLLRELHEQPDVLNAEPRSGRLEPAPHVDMRVSHGLRRVLASADKACQDDAKTIEPLHLLAAIVEDRESKPAQLLSAHGITRQTVAKALDSLTET